MLKIGISMELSYERNGLERLIREYFMERSMEIELSLFDNGCNLYMEHISEFGYFNLIFMDVSKEGMKYARKVRERDSQVRIALMAVDTAYAMEGYDIAATGYLLIPFKRECVRRLLNSYMTECHERSCKTLLVKQRTNQRRIPYHDIIFIESDDKVLLIHTNEDIYRIYASMRAVEEELKNKNFLRCHQSYIVNMDAVRALVGDSFIVSSNERVPIRKKELRRFREEFIKYVNGEG